MKKDAIQITQDDQGHWTARIDTLDTCTSIIHDEDRENIEKRAMDIYIKAIDRKEARQGRRFDQVKLKQNPSFLFERNKAYK